MSVSVLGSKPLAKREPQSSGWGTSVDKKVTAKYQRVVGNEVENAILRTMEAFRAEVLKSIVLNN